MNQIILRAAGVNFVFCMSSGVQGSLSCGEYSVPWHFPAGLKVYSQMSARRGLGRWPATLPVLSLLISVLLSLNRQVFLQVSPSGYFVHMQQIFGLLYELIQALVVHNIFAKVNFIFKVEILIICHTFSYLISISDRIRQENGFLSTLLWLYLGPRGAHRQ